MNIKVSIQNEGFKLKTGKEASWAMEAPQHFVKLEACRNSFAAFQILVQCDQDVCINVSDDPWFSQYNHARILCVRHSGLLDPIINHIGMYTGDDGQMYADVLKSDTTVFVKANVPHSIFVRFEIPRDLTPGKYTGQFKILSSHLFENETVEETLRYTVNVRNVTLPDAGDHKMYLNLWQHNCNIARKAGVQNWSDAHFAIIEQYLKPLAALGQCCVTAVVSEVPWAGQRCFAKLNTPSNMFEYSMVRVRRNADKTFTCDFGILDRYIELCFAHGIDREIEVLGLINNWVAEEEGYVNFTKTPEAIRIRYRMPDGSFRYMRKTADIAWYIKAVYEHFVEKGWLDKVRVVADEPADHEKLRKSLAMIKKLAPGFRFKAAFGRKRFFDEFKEEIDDFCVILTGLTPEAVQWKKIYREDKRHRFTFYVCCFPLLPNMYLSSDLLETRYLMVLASYFGLSGFLRWNFTVWPEDPRRDIRYGTWPAGDTNFVYPGGAMQPLLSLRYLALRRGIEDYELLAMLQQAGDEGELKKAYKMIITNENFGEFYDEDTPHIPFEKMSAAKHRDYEKMRSSICTALEK